MTHLSRRAFVASTVAAAACAQDQSAGASAETFACPPCGCSEDGEKFQTPGRCPDCDMTLIPTQESNLGVEPAALAPRAGSFDISGGAGRAEHLIKVHYYLPGAYSPDTRILLVVPGAGRNSFEYRNEWLGVARRENTLVAAMGYPDEHYDFAAYHMGGVIKNLELRNPDTATPGVIRIDDGDLTFDTNPNPEEWLFNDFDRVFGYLKKATGLPAPHYDIFGHSAGGQILHRMALFYPASRARKILAANAGWYTLPNLNAPLPSGLLGSPITKNDLVRSFASNLTILLGENDNSDRAGGTLLHTPTIDRQGLDRLSRGRNFYELSHRQADALGADFRWALSTVPNVGHDFREMSKAAAGLVQN
ncbi:MAG: heavy metal-binding domain-containing protein [Pseudomonadota bacterium]